MHRLSALLSICAFALLLGCGDDEEAGIRPVGDYMPLQVGARWTYAAGEGDAAEETRTIIEQSRRSGVTWYRIAVASGNSVSSEFEIAVAGDRLLMREPGGGSETMLLRDPVVAGGRWSMETEVESPTTEVPAAPAQDGETPTDNETPTDDEEPGDGGTPDDSETMESEPIVTRFDILSTTDIVVTPAGSFENVVTVRSFTENTDTAFYYFAADNGLVKLVQETAGSEPLDAPAKSGSFTMLELSKFELEPEPESTDEDATQ